MRFDPTKRTAASTVLIAGFVAAVVTQTGGVAWVPPLEISRSTIDGGGGMRAVGGSYELSATIGQPDVRLTRGGDYRLSAAFWFPIPPGDSGDDGMVDLPDFAEFLGCARGPNGGAPATECRVFDVNESKTVDLADFAEVQTSFSGP